MKIASEDDYQIAKTEYSTPPNYPDDRTINILKHITKDIRTSKKARTKSRTYNQKAV